MQRAVSGFFFLFAVCGAAQRVSGGGSDPPAPQQDLPAADPARPNVTNPAHIPPPGYLQFEQGIVEADGSPGLNRQFSIVQTTKLSLNHYAMVQIASQPFAWTALQPSGLSRDTGDLTLGGQVLFNDRAEGRDNRPTIALLYNGRVRAGSAPDLDIGSFSQGLTFLASGTNFGIHYDANLLVNEQPGAGSRGDTVRRAQFGQTIALTRQISEPFSVSGEIWHFTEPLVFSTRAGNSKLRSNAGGLLVNCAYTVRPNLVLDAGVEHGLTSTSTAWQGFAGFTYLLPHRLWQGGRR